MLVQYYLIHHILNYSKGSHENQQSLKWSQWNLLKVYSVSNGSHGSLFTATRLSNGHIGTRIPGL